MTVSCLVRNRKLSKNNIRQCGRVTAKSRLCDELQHVFSNICQSPTSFLRLSSAPNMTSNGPLEVARRLYNLGASEFVY